MRVERGRFWRTNGAVSAHRTVNGEDQKRKEGGTEPPRK